MAGVIVVVVELLFDATSSSPIIASVGSCSVGTDVVVEPVGSSNMDVDVDNDVDAVDGAEEEEEDDANATDHRHGCKRRKVPMGLSIRERRA
jgi:hypothetical protein